MNVYDFDGTIYRGDSSVDFFGFAFRKKPSLIHFLPKISWGFVKYLFRITDKTGLKEYWFSFLKAVDGELLVKEFWKKNGCKIQTWYVEQKKESDIIISASPDFLVRPLCEELGIRNVIATNIDIKTGKCSGVNCKGTEKVRRFSEEYPGCHIDEFYSDSKTDKPLAEMSEKAYLVKGDKIRSWNK